MRTSYCTHLLLLAAIVGLPLPSVVSDAAEPDALQMASDVVQFSRAPGGLCAVVGSEDVGLALAVAKQGSFVVQCLCAAPKRLASLRASVRSRGMYGTVSADAWTPGALPYVDNLVNIVVADSYPRLMAAGLSPEEVARVLAPLGVAYLGSSSANAGSWVAQLQAKLRAMGMAEVSVVKAGGLWVRMRKPWPADIDEWTHYLHGADGNPVAQDLVVGPPQRYQWTGSPLWLRSHETDSSVSTMVTARGRLFYIVDQAPISLAGDNPLPDKWCLAARDAFNGVDLWKVPIRRWGWREWKNAWFSCRPGDMPLNIRSRLVAVGDKVYVTLGYHAPVTELDARTGEVLKTYAGTERTGEVLYLDGTLVLSVLEGDGAKVMAVDAVSGKRLWVTEAVYRGTTVDYVKWRAKRGSVKPPKLDPALNIATDGKVVALIDLDKLVGLDFRTGAEKWRAEFPIDDADRSAGGIQAKGNLWNGTMIVSDRVVIHASPSKLAAFSGDTGELLWQQPKKYIGHLWYEWKDVFVIDGLVWTWSAELEEGTFQIGRSRKQRTRYPRTANGYDLKTGECKREVSLGTIFKTQHHHRCYRNKATSRYILASRRGTEFVDLKHGKHMIHNWVRGTCHMGMMPANGLQYAPPHPCACYIDEKLMGMNALAAGGPQAQVKGQRSARLERGPAYGKTGDGQSAIENLHDWPAFRHDSMRTGAASTTVPADLPILWRAEVGGKVSPVIAVADRVYAALVDEHHVVCLDADSGSPVWEFAAGGRIDSPPTYHRGTVLFGSADGWVYCVRASDGQLVWRFHAAPEDRLMAAFGQLESAWPVHGSVLVQNGAVYFAAGRSSHLDGGIHLYGLDAATGETRCATTLTGPSYGVGDFEENFRLPMGSLPDVLMGDGKLIYMGAKAFDGTLQRQKGKPGISVRSGMLDDTYFKRVPWRYGRGDYGRLLVHDSRSVYYVRMFDTLRGLDPTVYFIPGSQGYLLAGKNMGGKRNTWAERVRVRIRAMVVANGRLFVAGPPDVVDPGDPLGAFEGRKGGVLYAIDAATGERLGEQTLPSPPVFNGAAAARGRLYLTQEDGSIACFGQR